MKESPLTKLTTALRGPDEYRHVLRAIRQIASHSDPVFREFALRQTTQLAQELHELARGEIVFSGTETWRAAYDKILNSLQFTNYFSVSWVATDNYWHDLPGRQSMKLNFHLLDMGLRIERILILSSDLWPYAAPLPQPRIRRWIEDQHYRGILVSLIRANELKYEEDLRRDFGIYGDRATGEQELDAESRTIRFILRFDEVAVRLAKDRWERLLLFAEPYAEILDRQATAM